MWKRAHRCGHAVTLCHDGIAVDTSTLTDAIETITIRHSKRTLARKSCTKTKITLAHKYFACMFPPQVRWRSIIRGRPIAPIGAFSAGSAFSTIAANISHLWSHDKCASKSTLHNDSAKDLAMFGWFCIFAPFPTLTTSLSWKHSSVPSMVKWSTARSCQLVHVFRLKTWNHSKKSSCCPHHGSTLQKSKTWATAWATWEMGILQLHHRYHRYRLHWNHRYRLHRLPQGVICPDESLGTSSIASGGWKLSERPLACDMSERPKFLFSRSSWQLLDPITYWSAKFAKCWVWSSWLLPILEDELAFDFELAMVQSDLFVSLVGILSVRVCRRRSIRMLRRRATCLWGLEARSWLPYLWQQC